MSPNTEKSLRMHNPDIPIHGTVYGVLLNSQAEWHSAEHAMHDAPYKAPPAAPVLYIKTANTWSAHAASIAIPAPAAEVEIGATLGAVMGAPNASGAPHVRGFVLLNDVSLPHSVAQQGFYRPPVKYKNCDGFLGIGAQLVSASDVPHPHALHIEVRINGELRQTVALADMRRQLPQLLAEVGEFMTLQAGDVLMLGLDVCADTAQRPRVKAGDVVDIHVPELPALGTLRNSFTQEAV